MQHNRKLQHESVTKSFLWLLAVVFLLRRLLKLTIPIFLNVEKQGLTIKIQLGAKSEKYVVENFNTRKMLVVSTHLHMAFEGFCHCKHHCLKHDSQPPTIQNFYAIVCV